MMIRLDPPLGLVTPKGTGFAHFIIDYGQEHNLIWVVFIDDTRECWSFQNSDVRLQDNQTMTRNFKNTVVDLKKSTSE
jgi:hypothetical protein